MSSLKGLVIILDGLGDRPCKTLDYRTPLEYAVTPTLDSLVQHNQCGLMDPLQPGIPVDTHTGVSILFGTHPIDAIKIRRGPIEAAGIGLEMKTGDLFFRANLATAYNDNGLLLIKDRRAGRIKQNVEDLCQSLQNIDLGKNYRASLYPATHHRCVLKLSNGALSHHVTDTDPGGKKKQLTILHCKPFLEKPEARTTADLINQFTKISHQTLSNHPVNKYRIENSLLPANAVIVRSPGKFSEYKNLLSKLKLKISVIAAESTILGLGNLFSFTSITDPEFTACDNTNIDKKLAFAVQSLESHDLAFIHVKATDTTAHDKNPIAKANLINTFDKALKSSKVDFENTVIGLCADHSTDSNSGEHTGDAVPIFIHNPNNGRRDKVGRFSEIECSDGSLGRITAHHFLTSVLDAMEKLQNLKSEDAEYLSPLVHSKLKNY